MNAPGDVPSQTLRSEPVLEKLSLEQKKQRVEDLLKTLPALARTASRTEMDKNVDDFVPKLDKLLKDLRLEKSEAASIASSLVGMVSQKGYGAADFSHELLKVAYAIQPTTEQNEAVAPLALSREVSGAAKKAAQVEIGNGQTPGVVGDAM